MKNLIVLESNVLLIKSDMNITSLLSVQVVVVSLYLNRGEKARDIRKIK